MAARAGFKVARGAVVGLGLVAAACATMTADKEALLQKAGFRKVVADTPQKMAHLKTLPERTLVARSKDGKQYYVYADPTYCKCLYVGDAQQYAAYQQAAREAKVAEDEATAVEEQKEWETSYYSGR